MAVEEIWKKAEEKLKSSDEKELTEDLLTVQHEGLNFRARYAFGRIFLLFDFPYFEDKKRLQELRKIVYGTVSKYKGKNGRDITPVLILNLNSFVKII